MKEIDVVFFVEHADRELDVICRIADLLRAQGVTSVILSIFFHAHLLLHNYKARVFVFPFVMCPKNWPTRLVHEMYGDSVLYVNMNWEQLLSPANREYKKPRNSFQRRCVRQIAWDESFRAYLLEHGVEEDNIHVIGNPANEILRQQLSKRGELRQMLSQELGLDSERVWLFFPMNYGWAFTSDYLTRTRVAAGYDERIAWEYKAFSQRNLRTFIEWTSAQAKGFKEKLFIVRPHPSVSCEQYRDRFLDINGDAETNIIITKHRSVREWLPTVDAVFSSWSSVAWDAYNVGIPSYLLAPYGRPGWLNAEWKDKLPNITTVEEFGDTIARVTLLPMSKLIEGKAQGAIARHVELLYSLISEMNLRAPEPQRMHLHWLTSLKLLKVFAYSHIFRHPRLGKLTNEPLLYDFFTPRVFE